MAASAAFEQLARTLAGTFQNRDQALADPAWYVHLRLWCCPTSLFANDSVTFLIEQASAAFDQAPYRQRILRIRNEHNQLTAEYYALKDPLAWQGATQNPEQLQTLQPNDLQTLVDSRLIITVKLEGHTTRFEARQPPGKYCQFAVNGETKLVELAFDAIAPNSGNSAPAAFWMCDKGIDAATSKPTWGALYGPFRLVKTDDQSAQLPQPLSSQSA